MRKQPSAKLEAGRIRDGAYGSDPSEKMQGAFSIQGPCGTPLRIISSDGTDPEAEGWEHVSVSIGHRIPNWIEMSFVKQMFWEDHECVVQFHPPLSEYVNFHPNCLHLWRNTKQEIILPPSSLVGPKTEIA